MSHHGLPDPGEIVPQVQALEAAILGAPELVLLENLYIAYASEARGIARAILGDSDLAADAVHNGFLELLRYVVGGRRWYDPAESRGMVLRNVRWAALNIHRTRRHPHEHLTPSLPEADADAAAWARGEARALWTRRPVTCLPSGTVKALSGKIREP